MKASMKGSMKASKARKRKQPAGQPRASKRRGSKPRSLALTGTAQIRAAAGEAGEGEGQAKARRFSMVAYSGETIRQWWCDCAIVIDLESLRLPASLPILYDHRSFEADWVAGRAESLRVESGRIIADGPIYSSTEGGKKVLLLADEGHEWQCSVGGDVGHLEFIEAGKSVNVNGRDYPGPVEVARDVDLREISFVVLGAAKNTSALVANRVRGGMMSFEEWLLSMGFEDPASLTEVQRANLQQLYNEEYGEDDDSAGAADAGDASPPPAAPPAAAGEDGEEDDMAARRQQDLRASRAAEITRQDEIRRLCAAARTQTIAVQGRTLPLEAHAVSEGWSVQRTELEILRRERETAGPFIAAHSHAGDCTLQALQCAMILRAGGRLDHRAYQTQQAVGIGLPAFLRANINAEARQRAMEAAHRYSEMSMLDLCREAVRLDGRTPGTSRRDVIQAAFSGSALTNIFTTNINALVLATYMEHPDTTQGWVRETEAADFRTMERIRLAKAGALARLPRGGTAAHESRSDTKESYKVARYAKQFIVDEQDVIDDYFNALADVPVEMGNGAARLRPELVYSILKANAALDADAVTLFHNSSHSNTDTSAALAAATLKTGVTAIRKQTENSVCLNLMPTHLIVPSVLDFTARELVNSTTIVIAGTAGSVTERGVMNSLAYVGLQVVSDARLDNGVVDPSTGTSYSGDSNDWFLAAAGGYGLEVAYLRGTGRSPQTRSFQLERGQWGIGWDIAMDIGAKALDYRGLYRGVG